MISKMGSSFLASIYELMLTERYTMGTINTHLYWIAFFIRSQQ